jgi:IS5 family transposase
MYCVANWFNLGDDACAEALYDVALFREFCRIDLGEGRVPDATTLLHFRHLLEKHALGVALFAKVGELLQAHGLRFSGGTIVDATLIGAPCSTKTGRVTVFAVKRFLCAKGGLVGNVVRPRSIRRIIHICRD